MDVNIRINHALKKYGDNTIITDLSLDIKKGEFFHSSWSIWMWENYITKDDSRFSTQLKAGIFYFNDNRINDVEPSKRNIGMVFQNYAIFPKLDS